MNKTEESYKGSEQMHYWCVKQKIAALSTTVESIPIWKGAVNVTCPTNHAISSLGLFDVPRKTKVLSNIDTCACVCLWGINSNIEVSCKTNMTKQSVALVWCSTVN